FLCAQDLHADTLDAKIRTLLLIYGKVQPLVALPDFFTFRQVQQQFFLENILFTTASKQGKLTLSPVFITNK
ncbi:MAG: hypothetical protein AAF655_18640, partial [Bacteroidota bacterium]